MHHLLLSTVAMRSTMHPTRQARFSECGYRLVFPQITGACSLDVARILLRSAISADLRANRGCMTDERTDEHCNNITIISRDIGRYIKAKNTNSTLAKITD